MKKKRINQTVFGRGFYTQRFVIDASRGREILVSLKDLGKVFYQRVASFIKRKPFSSFLVALVLLFLVMAVNVFLAPKAQEAKKEQIEKEVEVYRVGTVPRMNILAQVEKSGVVTIVAQAPGIVSAIHLTEGESVRRGSNLIQLASNYSGGNAAGVGLAIATKQNQLTQETFNLQKELISKQREVADKSDASSDNLRSITDKSLDDTRSIISLNDSILSAIDSNLANLEAGNAGGVNDTSILQTKQLKSQFLSANNQVKQALRTAEFSASGDKPPARLSDLQREINLKQLDVQEKSLVINKEISQLQLSLAAINASAFHPTSPFAGTIERVHVRIGESVNPGTPLVSITGNKQEIAAVARVPGKIAKSISKFEESTVYMGNKTFKIIPAYISSEAIDGQLYTVIFSIPQEYQSHITDASYIRIEAPIGMLNTSGAIPFIPIDSVYQTQDAAFVYIVGQDNAAVSKEVILGEVVGDNVEIVSGLSSGDQVITNRNVIAGDRVSIVN